jgi:GNAT superfamily N-acetyltransferase
LSRVSRPQPKAYDLRPYHAVMKILCLASGDADVVLAGAELFDAPPTEAWIAKFLSSEGHRNRGIGTTLVKSLAELARAAGCYGMWVGTEPDNAAALATYRAAGAALPEPFVTLEWIFDDHPS